MDDFYDDDYLDNLDEEELSNLLDDQDPEEDSENEENDEEANDANEEEEDRLNGSEQRAANAVKTLKAISKSMHKAKAKVDSATVRIKSLGFAPPILQAQEKEAKKQCKEILKLKNRNFRALKMQIKRKYKDLQAEFAKEQAKIMAEKESIKASLRRLDSEVYAAWGRFWHKIMSVIAPAIPVILIVGIILIAAVVVVGVVVSNKDDIDKDGLQSTPWAANGEKFYGVRLIYEDKEQEKAELIKNYSNIIMSSVEYAENENADIGLDIKITIAEADLSNIESHENYTLIKSVADVVYGADNSGTAPTSLDETLNGIKYFGINSALHQEVANKIWAYIKETENMYTITEGATLNEEKVAGNILTSVSTNTVRTEKLFVEDQIFAKADDSYSVKTARNYKALIYMPKSGLTVDKVYIKTYQTDKDFSVTINNGEQQKSFSFDGTEESQNYFIVNNINYTVSAFASVDTNNPINGALSEIAKQANGINNLSLTTDEKGNTIENIYTYSKNTFRLEFNSNTAFMFSEIEMELK